MHQPDTDNKMFQLATELVCGTNSNIFLTGKAGTGKTTFLKYMKEISAKNLAVVAPTGVAAINAGGTTIHSFFQLPFTPFVPAAAPPLNNDVVNAHTLLGRMKLTNERRQVLRQLELLIIDEISMVRADTLDAIDLVLRHFRFRNYEPFGGVQVLMIGDMYQIPPVIKNEEWLLLSQFYKSGYFFDSRVMQQAQPVHIEFSKIYRQQDEHFVRLLNQVRNNSLDEEGKEMLSSRYQPGFSALQMHDRIILTTHNAKADEINGNRMSKLKSRSHLFDATIEGEFSEKAYPAEVQLQLKEGAQVMFIKNDTEKVRRYYNGKIGTVSKINNEQVLVRVDNNDDEIEVKKERWENIRYGLNKQSQQVEEDVIGSFTQYPLRLAWAVTIHKSQGLTFEKAVIDAGEAFSPGQVYVALSRCTTLDGLILLSQIPVHRLANDERIVQFSNRQHPEEQVQALLHVARHRYQEKLLEDLFDSSVLYKDLVNLQKLVLENVRFFHADLVTAVDALLNGLDALQQIAKKFSSQRKQLFVDETFPESNEDLQKRIRSAAAYFTNQLALLLQQMQNLGAVTESRQYAKEYNDLYKEVYLQIAQKKHLLQHAANGFSVAGYNTAKKNFVAPYVNVNAYATANGQQPVSSAHPILHKKLRQLRDEICESSNVPIYLVASGKTLDELTQYLPQNNEELQKISGFGKAKVDKYGSRFLELIIAYSAEHGLNSSITERPTKRQRKEPSKEIKTPTALISFNLYKEGKTIAEVALERNLTKSTVASHLCEFIKTGEMVVTQLVEPSKIDQIITTIKESKEEGLSPIKNKLGDGFSYIDIKAVQQHLAWLNKEIAQKE
jgi:lambda repressor-like predicted transcriptional regulator